MGSITIGMRRRIQFMTRIGKLIVIESFILFLIGMIALEFGEYFLHGFIIGTLAIPQFVNGVYFHILPSYKKYAPPMILIFPVLILPIVSLSLYIVGSSYYGLLFLLIHFIVLTGVVLLSILPLRDKLYSQKIIAFASYLSTTTVLIISLILELVRNLLVPILVVFIFPVGLIYAVSSTALTLTYNIKPRDSISILISIIQLIMPIFLLSGEPLLPEILLSLDLGLYLIMVRIESIGLWIKKIEEFSELSKTLHKNLVISSILSIPFMIISIFLIKYSLVNAIHVLLFGFIFMHIIGHTPLLLPTVLRMRAKGSHKLIYLPGLGAITAFLRMITVMEKLVSVLSGMLLLLLLVLLIHFSIRIK